MPPLTSASSLDIELKKCMVVEIGEGDVYMHVSLRIHVDRLVKVHFQKLGRSSIIILCVYIHVCVCVMSTAMLSLS